MNGVVLEEPRDTIMTWNAQIGYAQDPPKGGTSETEFI